ncbi:MAG: hypothetical protein MJA31_07780 [Clostridia bacterium]|nr:hypothetical protein [Clostridia bacterium]
MNHKRFTIIQGNNNQKEEKKKIFVSSYVTDTRLMGVIGMYIHWKMGEEDFYQIFHFDSEEYGFDNYKSIYGNHGGSLYVEKEAMMGGLGGKYRNINEDEARYILYQFVEMNKKLKLPLPEPKSEYEDLCSHLVSLSKSARENLMNKMCEAIVSDYQSINYFLMRSFAKDIDGIKYLTDEKELFIYEGKKPTTLLKNTIEKYQAADRISYVCESLIEENMKYKIKVTEIELEQKDERFYIMEAHERSEMIISPTEASFMLNRPEYINVYDIYDVTEFIKDIKEKKPHMLHNVHDSGQMFTEFNEDNRHVNNTIYMLNGDIYGVYYITNSDQLIMSSYHLNNIAEMEKSLVKEDLKKYMTLDEKLEFKESILYEFVHSGYEDFFDFLSEI